MPEIRIDQEPTLDILTPRGPALSATSDMPVVETKPDSSAPPEPETEAEAPEESAAPGPEDEDAGNTDDSESATESTEEVPGAPEAKKKSRGVQKKLDELRREAEDAKRMAAQEREERLKLYETLLRNQTAAEAEVHAAEDAEPHKPNRADYPDDDDWDAALLEYSERRAQFVSRQEIRQTIERERNEAQRRAIEQAQGEQQERHHRRVETAIEKYPDFHEVAENPNVVISIPMAHAILQSDAGPDIQYFLGANPAEAKRITQLSPPMQLVELGKIEARLSAPATPAEKPKPRISNAPPPIRPLKTGDAQPLAKDPGQMSMDEYIAHRKKETAAARR